MLQKIRTQPVLSDASPKHLEAIKEGKKFFIDSQKYNVLDKFKSLSQEEIRLKLRETSFPYAVCMENWAGDLNVASCIRNANAFNAQEIFYVGNRRFDKRGAQGAYHYKDIQFIPTIEQFKELNKKYRIIGVDNIPGATSLDNYRWVSSSRKDLPVMVVFGEEGCGLTPGMQELCEEIVEIKMHGSIRSLNAATASGIIMHSIVSQLRGIL